MSPKRVPWNSFEYPNSRRPHANKRTTRRFVSNNKIISFFYFSVQYPKTLRSYHSYFPFHSIFHLTSPLFFLFTSPGMTFQVAVPLQQPAIPIVRPQPVQMAPMMPVPMQVPNPNAISQQQRELDFYQQQQTMARQQPVPQPMQPVPQQPQQRSVVITIPNGVRPGNKMTVNLPDGRQVTVVVPQGMHPGNKMTVNYNATPAPAPQQHQPVQQYQAPPPPMPPMQPVMQQPQQSENKQVMITIPNGVVAGNRMTVNLPNGQQAQVVVPQGYSAGMKMTVSYKATRQQSQPPPPHHNNNNQSGQSMLSETEIEISYKDPPKYNG